MIRKLRRSAAAFVALVVVVLVAVVSAVAGCGGNASASALTTRSITKAQATAYAHAVNLRAGDLPGMSVTSPERESPTPTQKNRRSERCVGNVNPKLVLADIRSATFTSPANEEIHSTVEVLPSTSLARRNNAANDSQRAIKCAERFLPGEFNKSNGTRVRYGHISITRLPNPLPGVPGSFGIRISIPILGVPAAIEPTEPHLLLRPSKRPTGLVGFGV
jgi:hypothetical protein